MDKNITKSERDMVDLLNQEIKELQDNKKQIEEIARVICGFACDYENCDICPFNCINVPCEYHDYAINLINAGYRKITEGAVVLTQEEWDKVGIRLVQARKETAEKIFDKLYTWLNLEEIEKYGFVHIQKFDFLQKYREICKEISEGEK